MKSLIALFSILTFFSSCTTYAGEGYDVGDKATDFKLKNIDGSMVSLKSYNDAKGAIVIFTCNHCPFSVAYEDRIIALNNRYAPKGYPVIAINPNDPKREPDDSFENMKIRATEKNFTFPYLVDETQEVTKSYGATRTPHVFLLDKNEKGDFIVKYIGAIDDNTYSASEAENHYLQNAVDALLAGAEPSPGFTKAIGCTIKWNK